MCGFLERDKGIRFGNQGVARNVVEPPCSGVVTGRASVLFRCPTAVEPSCSGVTGSMNSMSGQAGPGRATL